MRRTRPLFLALVIAAATAATLTSVVVRTTRSVARARSRADLERVVPARGGTDEFVTSSACRACHPGEYSTWHDSFHRSMTRQASPDSIVAPFDGRTLAFAGHAHRVERAGAEHWVTLRDGSPSAERRRVVLVTGSHHMQVYWVANDDGSLTSFPFAYLIGDARWVPNEATLLRPPEDDVTYTWNRVCIRCHAVFGQPGFDPDTGHVSTRAAELGIACEACHGPGGRHVARQRNVIARYQQHLGDDPDPTIVNPANIGGHRAAEICGQCHGISMFTDEPQWLERGSAFRAGNPLSEFVQVVRHPVDEELPWVTDAVERDPDFLAGHFWTDGMVRVSGRELNGIRESPCWASEDYSCVSCHSMHASDPDDQLSDDAEKDEVCLACHERLRADPEQHTRHARESSGSRCYNCHMPHTTYGLLKAIRSHEVDSPSVETELATGRPNACNLCHLDQTLAWTAEQLTTRYGHARPELEREHETVAASVAWLVRGDAGQRALAAWHMGWEPALVASGRRWQAPLLATLLADPYPAVRQIAARSLKGLQGMSRLELDPMAPAASREAAVAQARATWHAGGGPPDRVGPALFIDSSGRLDEHAVAALLGLRDDRPVSLRE